MREPRARVPIAVLVLMTTFAGSEMAAQSMPPAAFEVTSIKENLTWTQPGSGLAAPQPGGRYRAVGVTVRRLIGDAYRLPATRVVGGPDWIGSARFDIDARAAGEPGPAEMMRMLQPLLVDRFKLAAHLEMQEMPVYALTTGRGRSGPQLRPSDAACAAAAANYFPSAAPTPDGPPCGDFRMGAGSLFARGMSMPQLAERLTTLAGRPVIDRTGLPGFYDLMLTWAPDTPGGFGPRAQGDAAPADNAAPTIFTAVREQLSLELVPQRAPLDVLIIDRVERPTAD